MTLLELALLALKKRDKNYKPPITKPIMQNTYECPIKEPHTHLVAGQSFPCEKGQQKDILLNRR